jgi:hypothetical protein
MTLDLKTLLLCNLPAPTNDVYSKLYQLGANNHGAAFFTLGGVDAVTVYPTPPLPDSGASGQPGASPQWLERVLQDKKDVIDQISEQATYHPIHLVRYTDGTPSTHETDYRFLLVTFVYGISDAFREELRAKGNWTIVTQVGDSAPRQTFDPSKKDNTDQTISKFEPVDNVTKPNAGAEKKVAKAPSYEVEIYDCINISDRVILTYTDDIFSVLDAICHLETDGKARKTYTMINFRLSDSGKIDSKIHDLIRDMPYHPGLSACIRGSIHDNDAWRHCCSEINNKVNGMSRYFINYGEADFTVSVPQISGVEVSQLLEYYQSASDTLSKACWDIHTELQMEKMPLGENTVNDPPEVLKVLYPQLSENLKALAESPNDLSLAWSLKELYSAQVNIERNPVLHGPSYLLWDSFRIFNDYFSAFRNKKSPIKDIADVRQMVLESQEGLDCSVQCLSQLTDQLTRNDDILFRGIGRIPAIATTLPENLLEFYHAFLRKIAETLVNIDHDKKITPSNYRYGFLIAPEFNQRARIFQVFKAEYHYRANPEGDRFRSWPSEQIHIIQFPINDIFRPLQCMIPLTHECFHFFGDHLRFRRKRAYAVSLFLAYLYVDAFAYDLSVGRETRNALANVVADFFMKKTTDDAGLYLSELERFLKHRCKQFLSDDGMSEILRQSRSNRISCDFMQYLDSIRKRASFAAGFDSRMEGNSGDVLTTKIILRYCFYYFRECYADFMSYLALGLEPAEYLHRFDQELPEYKNGKYIFRGRSNSESDRIVQARLLLICQRISIVFAALIQSKRLQKEEMERCIRESQEKTDRRDVYPQILETVDALLDPDRFPLAARTPGVFPIATLRTVVDYLTSVNNEIWDRDLDKEFDDLRKNFDKLIRNEKIFVVGTEDGRLTKGNDIIYENRNNHIKEDVKNYVESRA